MMMKKNFYFLLMAALVCGLSLSVTSCKSDDDSDNNGKGSEEQTDNEGLSTLENDQLADLIAAWTDTSRDDLNGTEWLNKQYEPTVGLALDETDPSIRSVVASTVEEADSMPQACWARWALTTRSLRALPTPTAKWAL